MKRFAAKQSIGYRLNFPHQKKDFLLQKDLFFLWICLHFHLNDYISKQTFAKNNFSSQ